MKRVFMNYLLRFLKLISEILEGCNRIKAAPPPNHLPMMEMAGRPGSVLTVENGSWWKKGTRKNWKRQSMFCYEEALLAKIQRYIV